jgi:phytoene dehydrogenase-like protein
VVVLEASDGVGGRVRTDRHPDGFLIDRGYQVMLEAYPALRRNVDLAALGLGRFDAGAMIWTGKRLVPLADPLRHPSAIVRNLTTPLFTLGDKLRLARLAARAYAAPWESAHEIAAGGPAVSAAELLWGAGFSRGFVERFALPFWGGITLDKSLGVSSSQLEFTLKMFLHGGAVLPAAGVQAVPEQLAGRLPTGTVRLHQRVSQLAKEGDRVAGIVVGGRRIDAAAVVVATDPPAAKALTGIGAIPERGVGQVTVYLRGKLDPGVGPRIVLDGTGKRTVNEIAPLSAAQPSYAPPGEHLIAAAMVGEGPLSKPDDEQLAEIARWDVAAMLGQPEAAWSTLRVVRVPFAQVAQPPGFPRDLPGVKTGVPGLYLASEATVDSSVNGAILSGEAAARAVITDTTSA